MIFNPNRKGIMALEGLEAEEVAPDAPEAEVAEHDPEALVENELIELEVSEGEVSEIENAIEEGEAIAVTVDGIAEQLELTAADEGEGVSEPVAAALTAAVEHFSQRLGYAGKPVMPAMESFSSNGADATKLAVEQHRQLIGGIEASMNVAQEGLMDTVLNQFTLFFSTEKKLVERLKTVSAEYDSKEVLTENIAAPAWGKALGGAGESVVTAADVVAALGALKSKYSVEKIAAFLNAQTENLKKAEELVGKHIFMADKTTMEAMEATLGEITAMDAAMAEELQLEKSGDKNADFEPLSAADKAKVVSAVEDLLEDAKLEAALKTFKAASAKLSMRLFGNSQTRLIGHYAADIRKAHKCNAAAVKSVSAIKKIVKQRVSVAHSAVSYISASAGKAAPAEAPAEKEEAAA